MNKINFKIHFDRSPMFKDLMYVDFYYRKQLYESPIFTNNKLSNNFSYLGDKEHIIGKIIMGRINKR